jgi:MFS family permease
MYAFLIFILKCNKLLYYNNFLLTLIFFTFNPQFAIFGSILTIGAMIGAITSGRLADFLGRKMVNTELSVWENVHTFIWFTFLTVSLL